jgi:uncharacterized protein
MAEKLHVRLLILQGTPFCNIDCRYCYLPDRTDRTRMQPATIDAVVERLLSEDLLGPHLTINWHAGEPLVAGVPFYRDALPRLARLSGGRTHVVHSVQTNGTLIDEAWCRLFREFDVRVGVSVDGPAFIHDAFRRDRRDRGTHDRCMRGIAHLRDAGVPFSVITVLTERSVDHADELYAFYVENGIEVVGFNIEELEGVHGDSTVRVEGFAARYDRFLRRFHELARRDGLLRVREFEYFQNRILHERAQSNDQVVPLAILTVDASGNFSTFSPELLGFKLERHGDFVLGNVHRAAIREALETARFRAIHDEIAAGVEACRQSCEYFVVCGGGAPSNKQFENGRMDTTVTDYCRYTKQAIAELVLEGLAAGASGQPRFTEKKGGMGELEIPPSNATPIRKPA